MDVGGVKCRCRFGGLAKSRTGKQSDRAEAGKGSHRVSSVPQDEVYSMTVKAANLFRRNFEKDTPR
jgi:hypothetical protein